MQLLPSISAQTLVCPLPSRAVPGTASHHLLVNKLINVTVEGEAAPGMAVVSDVPPG